MRKNTLIEKLQKFDGNPVIKLHDRNGEPVLFTLACTNNNDTIWLESESDVDMENEIQTRFDDALESGTDELDVYMSMLESGIDVDMVRRYMGNEVADNMENFCKEHGLI